MKDAKDAKDAGSDQTNDSEVNAATKVVVETKAAASVATKKASEAFKKAETHYSKLRKEW